MRSSRTYSIVTRSWHHGLINTSDRKFLCSLPTLDWFEWQGRHFRMAHATPQGDMFEYLAMAQWDERVKGLEEDFILLGHTHIQGMRSFGMQTVVNPGSVGLARDGGGEACYAVYDGSEMLLKRVPYDVNHTLRDLRLAPLPTDVIEGLAAVLSPDPITGVGSVRSQ